MSRRAVLSLVVVGFVLAFSVTIGLPLRAATYGDATSANHLAADQAWTVVAGGGGLDVTFIDISSGAAGDGWAIGYTNDNYRDVFAHFSNSTGRQLTVLTMTTWLNAVSMISSTDGWAISDDALWRFNGLAWQRTESPWLPIVGADAYNDIDFKGNTGWIVGEYSYSAFRFDGSSWITYTFPLDIAKSVSVADANDAWAVGYGSDMAHFSNDAWSLVTPNWNLPVGHYPRLRSIKMLNATEGWAAGYTTVSGAPTKCLLMHFTANQWSRVTCPLDDALLLGIDLRSATDVWAVGKLSNSAAAGVIFHYDGSTWTQVPASVATPILFAVELSGANDGWIAGGSGTVLRLINGNWTRVSGSTLTINPIEAVASNEVWYGDAQGQLTRWTGGATTVYTTPFSTPLSALDMVSSTAAWVGTQIQPYSPNFAVGRWLNGVWQTWPVPQYPTSISAVSADEAWITQGAGGAMVHIVSETLELQSLPLSTSSVDSVSMIDPTHGWAMVAWGRVITYTAGVWAEVNPALQSNEATNAIVGVSADEAWAVGYVSDCAAIPCILTPVVFHFSGGTWLTTTLPGWQSLNDISVVSPTEWWATGRSTTAGSAFLHFKEGLYETVSAAGEEVKAVSMLPDGMGFAAGTGSLLWYKAFPYRSYLPLIRR